MSTPDAWTLLASTNSHDRLRGARVLARAARPSERERIATALAAESVVWVRKALEEALLTAAAGRVPAEVTTGPAEYMEPTDEDLGHVWAEAMASLLHEVNPILGLLRVDGPREIQDYAASRCKLHVDRLAAVLQAFGDLGHASAGRPNLVEFELSECLRALVDGLREQNPVEVEFNGPVPCLVYGDPRLTDLCITNAVRNALEAQRAAKVNAPILVTWGDTDRDYWVSVLDRGVGLPAGFMHAFDVGKTSKKAHTGLGLAIARRAARSMRGTAALRPRQGGGVAFELRWPHRERDSE